LILIAFGIAILGPKFKRPVGDDKIDGDSRPPDQYDPRSVGINFISLLFWIPMPAKVLSMKRLKRDLKI
jgi:hypothetical protein